MSDYGVHRRTKPEPALPLTSARRSSTRPASAGTSPTTWCASTTATARGATGAVVPYGPLQLDPATMALHYGQEIFEGLKAYRQPDGSIATFRPDAERGPLRPLGAPARAWPNSLRTCSSSRCANWSPSTREWVPTDPTDSLYFRPFMIATEVGLGVNRPSSYAYLLIASPAGAYFAGGVKPVSVWLSTEYTRAAPGGTGEAKCAGNYAASFVAQAQAAAQGCDQVVWLDAAEHRWVEEMGGMNLYFVYGSGAERPHRHPGAHRHAAARHHPRLAAHAGRRPRLHRRGGQDLDRRVARGQRVRRDHRGLRLRHGRGDHPGRLGRRARPASGRSATARPVRSRCACASTSPASRPAVEPDTHGWMHPLS